MEPDGQSETRPSEEQERVQNERLELLEHLDALTEKPMVALGFAWLVLLVLEFTIGLSPALNNVTNVIWALFVVDFAVEFLIAPRKTEYLRRNWLTAVSLMLPALRILRAFRAVRAFRLLRVSRAARGTSLVRLITSLNRGMRATRMTLGRRGVGYAVAITIIVLFAASAGMLHFENPAALRAAGLADSDTAGLRSYADAFWWTAMALTTVGSEYWPRTAEGRILGWLVSVFALAVFGYITANIATAFIGKDSAEPRPDPDLKALRAEITALRVELARLRQDNPDGPTETSGR